MAENSKYCGSTVQWKTLEVKIQNMRTSFSVVGIIVWEMTHVNKNISWFQRFWLHLLLGSDLKNGR